MCQEQKLNPVNELERIRAHAVAASYLSTTGACHLVSALNPAHSSPDRPTATDPSLCTSF